ncbi:MAG TPA: pyruvate dehydrogenase (acetyl-transferring) E1 component subunit alpha [Desulfomonilaceae bacterium]|nr:pyruvate dehydrogenase (acetyl-transferring) E1 component subunit alpha [Desulfomonilaceae bacterium]
MQKDNLIQIMDQDGNVDESAIKGISDEEILKMYRLMVFTRLWNVKALSLQRQGRLGTLASVRGQEASNVGMGLALEPEDWFAPAFREYGAQFARGMDPVAMFQYWGGDERGNKPPSRTLPTCITVGSHLCHAVGIAFAAKIRGDKIAVMSSSGDGSTSQGDFHESLNFAGVFKLPVVFVIQNNFWAISVPLHKQTASVTIAEKACAYGFDGFRVDGNDIFAVYLTLKERLADARENFRPSLVELVTYRLDDHTTSDDASRYRTEEMIGPWRGRDPVDRLRKFLSAKRGWDEKKETDLQAELAAEVETAVQQFESLSPPDPMHMFDHMYYEMPWHLKEQREEMRRQIGEER